MKYKKKFINIVLILFISFKINAQDGASAFTLGITQNGYAGLFSYNYYVDSYHLDFFQGSVLITTSEIKYNDDIKIPYNELTFNLGYFKNIFKNRREAFKVCLGLGVVGGYEAINRGSNELSNGAVVESKSGFIYGAFASLDTDIYMTDQISFVIKANEYYHVNSSLGDFMPYAGIGFRIFLDY